MNGPRRTACFAKGMHNIPEVRSGSCTGSQNRKFYRKSEPEVLPEVRTGSCTESQNQKLYRKLYRKSDPEVVPEVRTGSYTVVAEFILECIRQSLSAY